MKDEIKRNTVSISSNGMPMIFMAQQSVTWRLGDKGQEGTGGVQISGIGTTSFDALKALDVSYASLETMLCPRLDTKNK